MESNIREGNPHDAENDPIQGEEADILGKDSILENSLEIEEPSKLLVSENPEPEGSVDVKKVSYESSELLCDVQKQEIETRRTQPSEGSEDVDEKGSDEQPEKDKDVSLLCITKSSDTQDKSPSKPDKVLKTGNVSGKKKKSKK